MSLLNSIIDFLWRIVLETASIFYESSVFILFGFALAIIAVATSAAYLLGEPVIAMMEVRSVACFRAFVAGTLLHVIVFSSVQRHASPYSASHTQTVVGERLGIIVGIFLLFLVPHGH